MTTTASLTDRLSDTKNGLAEIAPAHLFSVFSDEQARLDRTTDRTRHVSVGDTVPPFSLPTADGTTVDLDAVLAGGPAVLVFYRGAWCPYCNVALRAYRDEVLPQLTEQGVTLVAISPQGPEGSLTTAKTNGLAFPVLTDTGSAYARQLGIVFELTDDVQQAQQAFGNDFARINAGGEWQLPMPTVLVISQDRTVRFVDIRPDYTTRTEPAAILAAVTQVLDPTAA